ncbi:hypothetical protein CLI69_10475, partial [Prevotella intermedia]
MQNLRFWNAKQQPLHCVDSERVTQKLILRKIFTHFSGVKSIIAAEQQRAKGRAAEAMQRFAYVGKRNTLHRVRLASLRVLQAVAPFLLQTNHA